MLSYYHIIILSYHHYQEGIKKKEKAGKISRSADQDKSVSAWDQHLKTMRDDIDATREGKVRCVARCGAMPCQAIRYYVM